LSRQRDVLSIAVPSTVMLKTSAGGHMSFLDKAKVAAEKAATKAQQGVQQGQAKIEELQEKRKTDSLLRDLGSAYWDEVRHEGDHEAVVRALAVLDAHTAEGEPAAGEAAAAAEHAQAAEADPAGEAS
jgi:hypothetical protein